MIKTLNLQGRYLHFSGLLFIFMFTGTMNLRAQQAGNPYTLTDLKARQIQNSLTSNTADIAAYILDNFSTDHEKVRAIYTWIATHISYDIGRMLVISYDTAENEKIIQTLKTRKGICENYSALFEELCRKTGIPCYVIEGYTRQNGSIDQIPHSWCAARLEEAWYMFDPTWGSGYISERKFIKQFNNDYFMIRPADLIQTHMPFDYLWQFLPYPVSREEFSKGKILLKKTGTPFNFQDSITVYEKLDKIAQVRETIRRIENNGTKNNLVRDRLRFLIQELEIEQQNVTVRQYNAAVGDYNTGISSLNAFIQYRNQKFTPVKPDAEIREMIDFAVVRFRASLGILHGIILSDPVASANISSLDETCQQALANAKEQQNWLEKYLAKEQNERPSMFYKPIRTYIPSN